MPKNDKKALTLLDPAEYNNAYELFADLAMDHLFAAAVLNNDLDGAIYVDNVKRPQSGFMSTKELQFLAGNPDNPAFNAGLKQVWQETIFMGHAPGATLEAIDLVFAGDSWQHQLKALFGDWRWPPIPNHARHYCLTGAGLEWQTLVPKGYVVQQLEPVLLAKQTAGPIPFIQTAANFTADMFGFCALRDGQIVCACATDVISGSACEIGIETDPEHYRRGLATVTAAATVEYALAHGFQQIWWICGNENLGSIRTAEKVGFTKRFESKGYFFILDEAEHKRQVNDGT